MIDAKMARQFQPWEFWPAWLFYLPILPWIGWQAIRNRGLMAWTAANPGIAGTGLIEPKHLILAKLNPSYVSPTAISPPNPTTFEQKRDWASAAIQERGWRYPLVLKPDEAERGQGMRLARDFTGVETYARKSSYRFLIQPYHEGPHEAGIFYYRMPGETVGRIFSITDKHFPIVEGDGRSTVEELIRRHPRYRRQSRAFLARHARQAGAVLSAGERFPLAMAGNHCQGAMFRDGSALWSPELEQAMDDVARPFEGFCFGRFDVRYADPHELHEGRGFVVIELNGVLAESTNIYDPSWRLRDAYRVLRRQWELLFQIGAANRDRGARAATLAEFGRDWLALRHRTRRENALSD